MLHKVICPPEQVVPGQYIYWNGLHSYYADQIPRKSLEEFGVQVVINNHLKKVFRVACPWFRTDGSIMHDRVVVPWAEYRYTILPSSIGAKMCNDSELLRGWTQCEIYYGITHLGDCDPDPIRQLAFKILRGDPQAIDLAQDVIARGQ